MLALTLLVARVIADNHDATVATDHPAAVADPLNTRLDLHVLPIAGRSGGRVRFTCSDKRSDRD